MTLEDWSEVIEFLIWFVVIIGIVDFMIGMYKKLIVPLKTSIKIKVLAGLSLLFFIVAISSYFSLAIQSFDPIQIFGVSVNVFQYVNPWKVLNWSFISFSLLSLYALCLSIILAIKNVSHRSYN